MKHLIIDLDARAHIQVRQRQASSPSTHHRHHRRGSRAEERNRSALDGDDTMREALIDSTQRSDELQTESCLRTKSHCHYCVARLLFSRGVRVSGNMTQKSVAEPLVSKDVTQKPKPINKTKSGQPLCKLGARPRFFEGGAGSAFFLGSVETSFCHKPQSPGT
jgi:hypothetical protein